MAQVIDSFNGDTNWGSIYGVTWLAYNFVPTDSYSIEAITVRLKRLGSPGTCTLSLRLVDGVTRKPTGSDLVSQTFNGDDLSDTTEDKKITFGTPLALTRGTEYACVIRAPGGSASHKISAKSGAGYTDPQYNISPDSGSSWSVYNTQTFWFQAWGTLSTYGTDGFIGIQYQGLIGDYRVDGNGTFTRVKQIASSSLHANFFAQKVAVSNVGDYLYVLGKMNTSPKKRRIYKLDRNLDIVTSYGTSGYVELNVQSFYSFGDIAVDSSDNILHCCNDNTTNNAMAYISPAGVVQWEGLIYTSAGTQAENLGTGAAFASDETPISLSDNAQCAVRMTKAGAFIDGYPVNGTAAAQITILSSGGNVYIHHLNSGGSPASVMYKFPEDNYTTPTFSESLKDFYPVNGWFLHSSNGDMYLPGTNAAGGDDDKFHRVSASDGSTVVNSYQLTSTLGQNSITSVCELKSGRVIYTSQANLASSDGTYYMYLMKENMAFGGGSSLDKLIDSDGYTWDSYPTDTDIIIAAYPQSNYVGRIDHDTTAGTLKTTGSKHGSAFNSLFGPRGTVASPVDGSIYVVGYQTSSTTRVYKINNELAIDTAWAGGTGYVEFTATCAGVTGQRFGFHVGAGGGIAVAMDDPDNGNPITLIDADGNLVWCGRARATVSLMSLTRTTLKGVAFSLTVMSWCALIMVRTRSLLRSYQLLMAAW
jgi:hypothetical protein